MNHKIYIILLLNFLFFNNTNAQQKFSTAGFFAVENAPRTVQSFNPGWRFFKENIENGQVVDLDDSDWEAANLPHGLEVLGENASGGRNYQGVAWYRKKFDLNAPKNGKVFLYFVHGV